MIAHNQRLIVVEVMGQQILVGSTENQISFVKLSSDLPVEQIPANKTPFFSRTDEYSYADIDVPRSDRTESRNEKRKIDTLNQRGNIDRSHLEQRESPRYERVEAVQPPVMNIPHVIVNTPFPVASEYNPPIEDRGFNLNKGLTDNTVESEDQEDLNEDDLLKKIRSLNEPKS